MEPISEPAHFMVGNWSVRIAKDPNWKQGKRDKNGTHVGPRRIVKVKYAGSTVLTANGIIAYTNAVDMVTFLHGRGHVPKKEKVRCMADLGAAARITAGLRQGCAHINPADTGEQFTLGLPMM